MARDLVCCPFVLSFTSFDGGLVRPATAPARGRTTTPRRVLPPHTSDRRRRCGQWFSREAHHLSASDPPTDRRPNPHLTASASFQHRHAAAAASPPLPPPPAAVVRPLAHGLSHHAPRAGAAERPDARRGRARRARPGDQRRHAARARRHRGATSSEGAMGCLIFLKTRRHSAHNVFLIQYPSPLSTTASNEPPHVRSLGARDTRPPRAPAESHVVRACA